ncbi:unnamed protein product [Rhizophagus irregularis]|nr:unnamed protein product [Rhizophagus irregularis]
MNSGYKPICLDKSIDGSMLRMIDVDMNIDCEGKEEGRDLGLDQEVDQEVEIEDEIEVEIEDEIEVEIEDGTEVEIEEEFRQATLRKTTPSTPTPMVNDKRSHANLLHDRWNRRWKKDIISHRLRISYKETYLARTKGNLPSAPRLSRAERRVLKNNQRIKAVAEGSLLHGTSVKHYEQRVEAKKWLTLVLDYHHNKMTHLTARYDDSNDTEHKRKLHQEMVVFNAQFCKDVSICATVPKSDDELYTYSNKGKAWICNPLQPHFKVDTSDDTTKIERRPNKRLTTSQFNPLPVGDHDDRLKRR